MNKKTILIACFVIAIVLGFIAWHFFYKRPAPVIAPPVAIEQPVEVEPPLVDVTPPPMDIIPEPPAVQPAAPKPPRKAVPKPKRKAVPLPRARPPVLAPAPRIRRPCERGAWCSAFRRQ